MLEIFSIWLASRKLKTGTSSLNWPLQVNVDNQDLQDCEVNLEPLDPLDLLDLQGQEDKMELQAHQVQEVRLDHQALLVL